MLCPRCQSPNRDNAKFCKGCGQLLYVETVAAGPAMQPVPSAPSSDDIEQVQAKEEAPGFVPAPPGATPPPPPPESLQPSTEAGSAAPSAVFAGETEGNNADHPGAIPPYDFSTEPTQALNAEQMEQYRQRRRWQEQAAQGQPDISEAPTILSPFPPLPSARPSEVGSSEPTIYAPAVPGSSIEPTIYTGSPVSFPPSDNSASEPTIYEPVPQEPPHAPDIAEFPTMIMSLEESQSASNDAPTEVATPEERSEDQAEGPEPVEQTEEQAGEEENVNSEDTDTAEEKVSAETAQEENPSLPEQGQGDFPVLAVGAVVGERYEIVQLVGEGEQEHIYEVTDRKGYLHCWNCGSEENAEGDEFCNDCGAELLNATYTMHEYPASPSKENGESVLQGSIINTLIENGHTYVVEQPQAALQGGSVNGVHLVASSLSDVGVSRQPGPNEDSTMFILLERVHESFAAPAGIFLVSDGMGGHANGQLASRMTSGMIANRVVHDLLAPPLETEKAGEEPKVFDGERLKEILRDAIDDANTAVCQVNTRDKSDMGATLTGFMIVGDRAYIFNVGDSRTYMLRDSKLYQLTNDHSLVGQLVAGGLIAPEDVYTHPQRSQIYRSIGDKLNVQIDITEQVIHPGDVLLSCSDGLWEMVHDPEITDILNVAPDPQTACAQLIEAANNNGGEDNISAVVVFVR